ncbi:MAG: TolC family protein [Desulfobacterales bacterium]
MKINQNFLSLFFMFVIVLSVVFPAFSVAQEPAEILTLKQTIENAIKANLGLQVSKEEIKATEATKKAQLTNFFPTLSATYQYKRNDEENTLNLENEYTFVASFTQPIFAGFSLLRQYNIAGLGLDAAKIEERLVRQDIILEAKTTYFLLLRTQKLLSIAEKTVIQINSQKEVAENYYQVGMTPLNDLLQAQVELANAKQELIVAKNNMQNAESDFNTLLRRPIDTPVAIEDILDYSPFEKDLDYCFAEAEKNRLEITIADLNVEIGEKELKLARKDYYPSINLHGEYFQIGTEPDVNGGEGISDPEGWRIRAVASWNFWEWGRTSYGVDEKISRFSQAKLRKKEILDNIQKEVKKAYLRTQEAEKAIITIEKAIEQAKENFRINEERFKEQMATSTDVLDAQTLLSRTVTNYYNALYAFQLAKAGLYRAMGQEIFE